MKPLCCIPSTGLELGTLAVGCGFFDLIERSRQALRRIASLLMLGICRRSSDPQPELESYDVDTLAPMQKNRVRVRVRVRCAQLGCGG